MKIAAELFLYLTSIIMSILSLSLLIWLPLYLFSKIKSGKKKTSVKKKLSFTICIPVYNEGKRVAGIVKSIEDLDFDEKRKEVIFVNDGSTDNTREIISKMTKKAKIIDVKHGGYYHAVNHGIKHASGDIILFMDADGKVCRDALKKLERHFQDDRVVHVSGRISSLRKNSPMLILKEMYYLFTFHFLKRCMSGVNALFHPSGAILAFRKKIFKEVGFFSKEDRGTMEFMLRVLKRGYIGIYDPTIKFSHIEPNDIKYHLEQQSEWLNGILFPFKKHLGVLFRPKYSSVAFLFPAFFIQLLGFPLITLLYFFSLLFVYLTNGLLDILIQNIITGILWVVVIPYIIVSLYTILALKDIKMKFTVYAFIWPLMIFYDGIIVIGQLLKEMVRR